VRAEAAARPRPARSRRERRPGRLRRLASRVAALLGVAGLAAVAWLAWVHETTTVKLQAGTPPLRLLVPAGANADSIGRDLQALGLTLHPAVFRLLARVRGVSGQLKAGEYELLGPLSLEQILDKLARGDVLRRPVTVPEGRTLAEIADLVASQGLDRDSFVRAASDPAPVRDLDPAAADLEGYLFPDTYDLPRTPDAPQVLVHRMTQRFRAVLAPQLDAIGRSGLNVRQVVTMASIVELETGQFGERPRIAAVFLNRLQKGMLLQTDPTVIYALKKAGRWDGNIRKRDLQLDSPYNTYRHAGLPPGPIGCPGREAILAVVDPAPTRALYFVSRNDGTHQFSETLAQHNRAVDRYQRRRAAS
jgi:UPF0755 protein